MDTYEKEYKEALEQAKKELATCGSMDCDAARLIFRLFPQLLESEDERMRKELIKYLRGDLDDITTDDTDRWINWLEKQKERKPSEWSEEDEKIIANLRSTLANISVRGFIKKETEQKYSAWLKSLRPQPHWKPSEEQMKALMNGLRILPPGENNDILISLYNDLKKLCYESTE